MLNFARRSGGCWFELPETSRFWPQIYHEAQITSAIFTKFLALSRPSFSVLVGRF